MLSKIILIIKERFDLQIGIVFRLIAAAGTHCPPCGEDPMAHTQIPLTQDEPPPHTVPLARQDPPAGAKIYSACLQEEIGTFITLSLRNYCDLE